MTTMTTAAASDRIADLHATHGNSLLRLLVRLTHGRHQMAEDLVQETMVRAWRHVDNLPTEPDRERRWLFTVARRLVIDVARARQSRPFEIPVLDLDWAAEPIDTADVAVGTRSILEAYDRLDDAQRTILADVYFRGEPAGEIAVRLGVPIGTVKSRAHYALKALRAGMAIVD